VAIPSFVSHGVMVAGTGAVSPTWPVGVHQADDIGLLYIEQSNQAGTTTLSTAAGFVEVSDSSQGAGLGAGAGGETRLSVFWSRATGATMGTPVVADLGNHQIATICVFRGCITTGNPWDITAGDTDAVGGSSAVTWPGDTTTVADCLIVHGLASGTDANGARVSGYANPDLANITERFDDGSQTPGHGGAIAVVTGEKAAAGTFSSTTATMTTASMQGRHVIALKPPAGGGGGAAPDTWHYRTRSQGAFFG
jgi:hypothetical protein